MTAAQGSTDASTAAPAESEPRCRWRLLAGPEREFCGREVPCREPALHSQSPNLLRNPNYLFCFFYGSLLLHHGVQYRSAGTPSPTK
jgi:hypothetical protein